MKRGQCSKQQLSFDFELSNVIPSSLKEEALEFVVFGGLEVIEFSGSLEVKELLVGHTIDARVTLLLEGEELKSILGVRGRAHSGERVSVAHVDGGVNLFLGPVLQIG